MNVFLSYSQSDRQIAAELSDRLKAAGLDVQGVFDVFPGDNIAKNIGDALQRSQAMVVLLSPEAMGSTWTRREIEYALASRNFENRLVPVFVKPTDEAPWFLRRMKAVKVGPERERAFNEVVETLKRMEDDLQKSREAIG